MKYEIQNVNTYQWNYIFTIHDQYNGHIKGNFISPNYKQHEQLRFERFMETRLVMLKSISVENDYSFQDQIKLSWKGVNTIATKTIEKETPHNVR